MRVQIPRLSLQFVENHAILSSCFSEDDSENELQSKPV